MLFHDLLDRRPVIEVVIDRRRLNAVPVVSREVEAVRPGRGVIFAVAERGVQERRFGLRRLAAQIEHRVGARSEAVVSRLRQQAAAPTQRRRRTAAARSGRSSADCRRAAARAPAGRASRSITSMNFDRARTAPGVSSTSNGTASRPRQVRPQRARPERGGSRNVLGETQTSSALPRSSCSSTRLPCGAKPSSVASAASDLRRH